MGPFDLSGKTALVTGASQGLGAHFARTLAAAGARVVLGARQAAKLAEVAAAVGGVPVALDVRDPGSIEAALEAAGPVDILINNAGVTAPGPALQTTPEAWDRVLGTNLTGAFAVAQAVARRMVAAGRGGSVVNIASILGLRVAGQVAAYAAAKAGLIQLTQALALEWARHGVRVNALAPGYIETDLNRAFFATEAGQAMIRRIPQRRLGRPDDLDGPLLLLASDAGRYMTGAVIAVDGGHLVSSL